jgi:serine/threonine-protein kinase HipA
LTSQPNQVQIKPLGDRRQRISTTFETQPSWPHVVQTLAQNIAGKKRTPDAIAARHWEAVAREIGYRPTDVRNRVQELVDRLVASRVEVTAEVAALPRATAGNALQTAEAVEGNALRIAGRL